MNTLQFIEKAKKVHGNKYDYSKVEYVNTRTKVCIICPKHGEFWQTPAQHLSNKNCKACAAEKNWENRKISFDDFVKKAKAKHNNKYDYSKVNFTNMTSKVCIVCPIHGEFWQTPSQHLKYGCNKCAIESRNRNLRATKEEFIEKAKKIHGDKYDYSKVNYINSGTKVCIICPIHGEFWQTPSQHLKYGCKKCADCHKNDDKRWTNEMFIDKIIKKFGDEYDVSNIKYINSRTKIKITCKKHGTIEVFPPYFLKNGCPKCYNEKIKANNELKKEIKLKKLKIEKENKITRTHDLYIKRFIEKHGDKYDYSKIGKVNGNTKVCIICPIHGEFWQIAKNHANGCNCPKCAKENLRNNLILGKDKFIEKAKSVHDDKYDYSKVEYVNYGTKVCIICPKHGEFWQTPGMHISEHQGCPECGTLSSYGENEIYNFIHDELKINTVSKRNKTIIPPKEIDIYIDSCKLGIEYDGLRWHSEKFGKNKDYHLNKTISCKENGVNLIHIFEDEWEEKKEIVKHKLSHLLNADKNLPKIYARKCIIREIDKLICDEFMEQYHIQGKAISSVRLGAFFNGELVGIMTFTKNNENKEFTLNRFATNFNYNVIGAASKILSVFIKKYNPNKITTFADRRWTIDENNNLYTKIGFRIDYITSPNYFYVTENDSQRKRFHKFNFRKQILHKKYGFDLSMTESEMAEKMGAYKIWDCGLFKYVWTKNDFEL